MLGLVLFLLFAAHVAIPCAVTARLPRFSPQGGMCQENKLFRADLDVNALFKIPVPAPFRMPAATSLAVMAATLIVLALPASVVRLRRFPGHRMRGRPFVTSTARFLPAFAAFRDA